MPSMINTNLTSLNSQNSLNKSQSALNTSIQRLSSGLRINSAADDAAGMAIATRMTSQINGITQASRNANDAISLTQTAAGALSSTSDLLQRMRDLAVQSGNSTNSDADRASMQTEVTQLKSEIDRVAQTTNFNGVHLLDGSFSAQSFQVGANATANDKIQMNGIGNMQTTSLGSGLSGSATLTSGLTTAALAAGDLTLNGVQVGDTAAGTQAGQSADSAYALAQAINAVGSQSGVTATANVTVATSITVAGTAPDGSAAAVAANSFTINGVSIGAIAIGVAATPLTSPPVAGGPSVPIAQGANVAEAINKVSSQTGVMASVDDTGAVKLTSTNGKSIDLQVAGTYTSATMLSDTGLAANAAGSPTTGSGPAATAANDGAGNFTINGVTIGAIAAGGTAQGQGANTATAINLLTSKTGVSATSDSVTGALTLSAADGRNIDIEDGTTGTSTVALTTGLTAGVVHGNVNLSSSNANGIVVGGANDTSAGLHAFEGQVAASQSSTNTVSSVDISTSTGASDALAIIDKALTAVNTAQATMGAYQNRFSSVVTSLQSSVQNLTSARSRIQDADFAAESASLARGQVLQQAGTAMLAQANSLPSGVMALLR